MNSNKNSKKYLSFIIDDKTYALPILTLTGIIGNPKIVPITDAIESVVGIFYMKGNNIPVLDLRIILNKQDVFYPNKTCILLVNVSFKNQKKIVGFVVDSVCCTTYINELEINTLTTYSEDEFIKKVAVNNEKLIMILALDNVINKPDIILFLNQFWNYENVIAQANENGVEHG